MDGTPLLSNCHTQIQVIVPQGSAVLVISGSSQGRQKCWLLNYSVISFLMNGQLFSEYDRISNMLGLPHCSDKHWREIVGWLGKNVTSLAEWSCSQVQSEICARGDSKHWVTSYDGFYLTRGHHSNNCSATLHDYSTGKIAYFQHRTKRGVWHNWEGTSGGAEADIFNSILGEAKQAGFIISEMVTDKDSSMNAIYCRHFLEGTITYCSNHNAKTMHKDLQKVKSSKCQVSKLYFGHTIHIIIHTLKCRAAGLPRCRRMTEQFLTSCKSALNNLIGSDKVYSSENPFAAFSDGIINFHSHYCLNDHTSLWCFHDKVSFYVQAIQQTYNDLSRKKMESHTRLGIPLHARHRLMGSRSYSQQWQTNHKIMSLQVDI